MSKERIFYGFGPLPEHARFVTEVMRAADRLLGDPGFTPVRLKPGVVLTSVGPTQSVRFVTLGAEQPPADRQKIVATIGAMTVVDVWTAVPKNLEDLPLNEVLALTANGQVPLDGWQVRRTIVMSRDFSTMSPEEVRQHCMSVQVTPEDDKTYNGYYATIRGNDVAHHDPTKKGMDAHRGGPVLKGNAANGHDGTIRGGTEISGGRAQYKKATKGYEQFGPGWFRDVDKIKADKQAKRDQATDLDLRKRDALLPRKIGEL